jgi:DNA excision repair protein ERCC-2
MYLDLMVDDYEFIKLAHADIIIYSFHYLLDPKVATQVSKELLPNSIVVFDEAHNIDNVCIESLSIDLTKGMLDNAGKSIGALDEKIREIKRTDASKLQNEYERLVRGLGQSENTFESEEEATILGNPGMIT